MKKKQKPAPYEKVTNWNRNLPAASDFATAQYDFVQPVGLRNYDLELGHNYLFPAIDWTVPVAAKVRPAE